MADRRPSPTTIGCISWPTVRETMRRARSGAHGSLRTERLPTSPRSPPCPAQFTDTASRPTARVSRSGPTLRAPAPPSIAMTAPRRTCPGPETVASTRATADFTGIGIAGKRPARSAVSLPSRSKTVSPQARVRLSTARWVQAARTAIPRRCPSAAEKTSHGRAMAAACSLPRAKPARASPTPPISTSGFRTCPAMRRLT